MYFGLEEKNENFFQQSTELPEEQYFANKLNNQLKKSNVPKVSLKVYKKDLLKWAALFSNRGMYILDLYNKKENEKEEKRHY